MQIASSQFITVAPGIHWKHSGGQMKFPNGAIEKGSRSIIHQAMLSCQRLTSRFPWLTSSVLEKPLLVLSASQLGTCAFMAKVAPKDGFALLRAAIRHIYIQQKRAFLNTGVWTQVTLEEKIAGRPNGRWRQSGHKEEFRTSITKARVLPFRCISNN